MKPSIWTGLYSEMPLHDALRTLHGQGWNCFEVSTEHVAQIDSQAGSEIDLTRSVVEELSIEIPQAHAHLQADLASTDDDAREADIQTLARHLEICAAMGVKVVVMHPGVTGHKAPDQERARVRTQNLDALGRLGEIAARLGIRIGLENLMRPVVSHPGPLMDLIDAIGNDVFGVTLDTSHANVVKLDIPEAIRTFGRRLIATHFSDNDGSGDQHRTPGGGHIDWPPIMEALRDIGYEGPLNLEIPGERHRNPGLRLLNSQHALSVAQWLAGLQ